MNLDIYKVLYLGRYQDLLAEGVSARLVKPAQGNQEGSCQKFLKFFDKICQKIVLSPVDFPRVVNR